METFEFKIDMITPLNFSLIKICIVLITTQDFRHSVRFMALVRTTHGLICLFISITGDYNGFYWKAKAQFILCKRLKPLTKLLPGLVDT